MWRDTRLSNMKAAWGMDTSGKCEKITYDSQMLSLNRDEIATALASTHVTLLDKLLEA